MNAPWKAEFDEFAGYDSMSAGWRINDSTGQQVALVDYRHCPGWDYFDATPIPEADAVAHLIEAAPDLLAVAKKFLATMREVEMGITKSYAEVADMAEAAIAKARG